MAEMEDATTSTELDAILQDPARLTDRHGGETYLLPWGSKYYHVPKKNVVSFAKRHNSICSAQELGKLLVSTSEEEWYPFLRAEYLMRLKGLEGNQVFTTFKLDNNDQEKRILRMVPLCVGTACFRRYVQCHTNTDKMNDRQRIREEVLLWSGPIDLPGRDNGYVLSPIINEWSEAEPFVGTMAIWPGPNVLLKAADPIYPIIEYTSDVDSDEDDGIDFQNTNATTLRPTDGRLAHVPFVAPPVHELERMRAAHSRMKLAGEKMKTIREETNRYVAGLLEQNVQAQRTPAREALRSSAQTDAEDCSTKNAVRNATDEIFELKEKLSEGSYLEITKSLKRSWDCAL